MALYTLRYTSGNIHVAVYTWQYTRGSIHVEVYTWQCTRGSMHVAVYMWQYTRGGIHVAVYTWCSTRSAIGGNGMKTDQLGFRVFNCGHRFYEAKESFNCVGVFSGRPPLCTGYSMDKQSQIYEPVEWM